MIVLKNRMKTIIWKTMKTLKWTQMNMDLVTRKILNSIMTRMEIWETIKRIKTFKKVKKIIQNLISAL
jgi:hypothetical protein